MIRVDECRNFSMSEIDEYKNFVVFLKFLMIVMKMKMIVSRNFSLMMTREIVVLLMIDEAILLMIAASSSLE
jgi:hypothetical protein